jgi:predicted RNA binding protein YcfA (HicA-like mRNA interferase family)
MARLRPLLQKRVIGILLSNGFEQARSESHITFKKACGDGRILTTWVPHHREVTVFVIQHIIRQTEKDRQEFE